MSKSALFSVIIPAANDEKTIKRSLNSIVMQDFYSYEVIVVVNNSTDNTLDICNSMAESHANIKVIQATKHGRSLARNTGIKYAKGRFLIFLDADDTLEHGRLSRSKIFFSEHRNYDAYCEAIRYIGLKRETLKLQIITDDMFSKILYRNCFPINAVTFRNKNITMFREDIEYNEDWLFWVDNLFLKKVFFSDYIGGSVYITGRNTMKNKKKMLEYYLLVRSIINDKYQMNFLESRKSNIALLLRYFALENRNSNIEHVVQKSMWEYKFVKLVYYFPLMRRMWKAKLLNEWKSKLY